MSDGGSNGDRYGYRRARIVCGLALFWGAIALLFIDAFNGPERTTDVATLTAMFTAGCILLGIDPVKDRLNR